MEKIALYGPGSFYTPELIIEKSSIISRMIGLLISFGLHIIIFFAALFYFNDLILGYPSQLPLMMQNAIHVELAEELPNKYYYANKTEITEQQKQIVEPEIKEAVLSTVKIAKENNKDIDGSSTVTENIANKVRYEQVLIDKLEIALNNIPDHLELPNSIIMIIKLDKKGRAINITLSPNLEPTTAQILKENIMQASPFPKPPQNLFQGEYVSFKIPFGH